VLHGNVCPGILLQSGPTFGLSTTHAIFGPDSDAPKTYLTQNTTATFVLCLSALSLLFSWIGFVSCLPALSLLFGGTKHYYKKSFARRFHFFSEVGMILNRLG
jgi:hypothetical protein